MKVNGDKMAFAKGNPNGEYQKLGTRKIPGDGKIGGLDRDRYGSADNSSGNYANPKRKILAIR